MTDKEIEQHRNSHLGRLIVKFDQKYDYNKGNYIKPTRILGREIGIFLNFCDDLPDHGIVYWQEQMKYETMWLGDIAFVDDFNV